MTRELVLDTLTSANVEEARGWRNEALVGLRTPYLLTAEMQQRFYQNVVCNRESDARYWAVRLVLPNARPMVAMAGLTTIQWENRLAEISLIVKPMHRNNGVGREAVDLVLSEAFDSLGLKTVFGEVYACNPAIDFWKRIAAAYCAAEVVLPNRKFWGGKFWDSYYFSIDVDAWSRAGAARAIGPDAHAHDGTALLDALGSARKSPGFPPNREVREGDVQKR